jgi:hypothetical protein
MFWHRVMLKVHTNMSAKYAAFVLSVDVSAVCCSEVMWACV